MFKLNLNEKIKKNSKVSGQLITVLPPNLSSYHSRTVPNRTRTELNRTRTVLDRTLPYSTVLYRTFYCTFFRTFYHTFTVFISNLISVLFTILITVLITEKNSVNYRSHTHTKLIHSS